MSKADEVAQRATSKVPDVIPPTAVAPGITDPRDAARAELKAALAAIEVKGNIPRRVQEASARTAVDVRRAAHEKPLLVGAAVIGVALATGGLVWAIARAIAR